MRAPAGSSRGSNPVTTGPMSQCGACQRLRGPFSDGAPEGLDGPWCAAFPEGIPADIFDNRVDHRNPVEGDHGLQWLARDGAKYPKTFLSGVSMTAAAVELDVATEPEIEPVEEKTPGMIALVPTAADVARLAQPYNEDEAVVAGAGELGAVRPDEMHLTLAYFPDVTSIDRQTVLDVAEYLAKQAGGPLTAEASSVCYFNPTGPEPCAVLGVGGDGLADLHADLTTYLHMAGVNLDGQHRPWVPHVTITYTEDPYDVADLVDLCGPVAFDRLRVAFGDEVTDFPLSG